MWEEQDHEVSQWFITILGNRMEMRLRDDVRLTGRRQGRDSRELCSGRRRAESL